MQVDAMTAAIEAELDPVMQQSPLLQAFANSGFDERVDCALLKHTCANAALDILAASRLYDYGVDTLQVQQVRQQQSSRAGADYTNLSSHISVRVLFFAQSLPPRRGNRRAAYHRIATRG